MVWLSRINNELGANFNLDNFSHYSFFNEEQQRIEMYLRSDVEQSVEISKANLKLEFKKDELIHTEHSHKYSIIQIEEMMASTDLCINHLWQDENHHFALILASKN